MYIFINSCHSRNAPALETNGGYQLFSVLQGIFNFPLQVDGIKMLSNRDIVLNHTVCVLQELWKE